MMNERTKTMKIKYFGMFTDEGNALVWGMVETAKRADLDWRTVVDMLYDVACLDGFEEASDTAVREAVFMELQNKVDAEA